MSDSLMKPCPCCGQQESVKIMKASEEESFDASNDDSYAIICDFTDGGCGCCGGHRLTLDEAIEVWNRRAPAQQPAADTSIQRTHSADVSKPDAELNISPAAAPVQAAVVPQPWKWLVSWGMGDEEICQTEAMAKRQKRLLDENGWLNVVIEPIYRAAPAAPSPAPVHPDDAAVDRFAIAMKEKMAASRNKGRSGWDDETQCTESMLARMLVEHVAKGDPVDIANFAMMLHQREAVAIEHHPCNGGQAKRAISTAVKPSANAAPSQAQTTPVADGGKYDPNNPEDTTYTN